MPNEQPKPIQGSLFEENYLLRTLGTIASQADVALTELVANAWDAGASKVSIGIPSVLGGHLKVQDDGCGMAREQFLKRWMTLGYDRTKHQGVDAEFPPDRSTWRRKSYGRTGLGRHSLLCFGDRYQVETWRDRVMNQFVVATASGHDPFILVEENSAEAQLDHGTALSVTVERNLPDAERIRTVLSGRFLSDPQFEIIVNDSSLMLTEHEGLVDRSTLEIEPGVEVEILFLS